MTGDREAALRSLLAAVRDALDVPRAAHPASDVDASTLRRERAAIVRAVCKSLIDGPLDNTAVHSAGRTLLTVLESAPVTYEVAAERFSDAVVAR